MSDHKIEKQVQRKFKGILFNVWDSFIMYRDDRNQESLKALTERIEIDGK